MLHRMAVACRIVADISENSKAEIPAEVDEMLPSHFWFDDKHKPCPA
jgi:hypothetical protein